MTLSCAQVSTTLQEFVASPGDLSALQNLNISCANNSPQAFLDYMLTSFTADGTHSCHQREQSGPCCRPKVERLPRRFYNI